MSSWDYDISWETLPLLIAKFQTGTFHCCFLLCPLSYSPLLWGFMVLCRSFERFLTFWSCPSLGLVENPKVKSSPNPCISEFLHSLCFCFLWKTNFAGNESSFWNAFFLWLSLYHAPGIYFSPVTTFFLDTTVTWKPVEIIYVFVSLFRLWSL